MNWLFPERVGKEYKARYCGPLNGEYVIDVDAFLVLFRHNHWVDEDWGVCESCLDMAKRITLQLCEAVSQYYKDLAIVFSGRMGFHVHVMDFDYRDWATFREKDPVWCHHAARFKFTKLLEKQVHCFDRRHFTVSCDPMRVVTVPNTLNAETGLVCNYIGGPKDLDALPISDVLERAKGYSRFCSHAETLENSAEGLGGNGSVKTCAKNTGEVAVTA